MVPVSEPVGLQNGTKNVCFFNSDLQLLFSLSHFRNIVLRYPSISDAADPCSIVRQLFHTICLCGQNRDNSVVTYHHILRLGLPGYRSGRQFDAQEKLQKRYKLKKNAISHDW